MGATVHFTGMLHVNDLQRVDADTEIGSVVGDASGTSWYVCDHRSKRALCVKMPHSLIEVIGNRADLAEVYDQHC